MEEAEQEETGIGCDLCDAWYHTDCEKLEDIHQNLIIYVSNVVIARYCY